MLTAEENELLTRVGPGTPCGDMLRPLSCNWLQCEENTGDVTHTYFLHGHMMAKNGLRGGEYYYRPFAQYGFQPFKWGLLKDWIAEGRAAAWAGATCSSSLTCCGRDSPCSGGCPSTTPTRGSSGSTSLIREEIFDDRYTLVGVPYGKARPQP